LQCRGIRGAITVPANNKESIVAATEKLLGEMTQANKIEIKDIAAIFFTTTSDLNAEFPATATRELGWPQHLGLRILMLVNTEKGPEEIVHIYLGGAKRLKNRS